MTENKIITAEEFADFLYSVFGQRKKPVNQQLIYLFCDYSLQVFKTDIQHFPEQLQWEYATCFLSTVTHLNPEHTKGIDETVIFFVEVIESLIPYVLKHPGKLMSLTLGINAMDEKLKQISLNNNLPY